jgi:hypothetical protein
MAHETHEANTHGKQLPRDLGTPEFVNGWQRRALVIGLAFSVVAVGLGFADGRSFDADHVL